MEKLFLGIDLGTSSIKISVQDNQNCEIYSTSINYEYDVIQESWSEICPEIWWKLILKELKKIFRHSWAKKIVSLSTTGQMHTIVLVNKNGESVRNAILWNDKRTRGEIQTIKDALHSKKSTRMNGDTVATGSPLANLLWIKNNEREKFEKIDKFMIAKDFINYRLTNKIATDYCDASTSSMYDFNTENWSKEVINTFDLPNKIFPSIYYSAKKLGIIDEKIKNELNIDHDIEVYVGTGDNAATYLASKSSSLEKELLVSIGTSGVVLVSGDKSKLSKTGKNIAFKLFPNDENIIIQGSISTGGKSLSWWVEDILKTNNFTEEIDINYTNKNSNMSEIFIPYLTGEKYIYKNSKFKGTFLNIEPSTTREIMTLSVLEGIVFSLKNLSDTIAETPYNSIKITGGGSKSKIIRKIFANTFDKKVEDYSLLSNAVNGAIRIAKHGHYEHNEVDKNTRTDIIYQDSMLVEIYQKKYGNYLSAVKALDMYYK